MTGYEWTKELETGHAMIDAQHKQLIMAINNLMDACAVGKGRSILNQTMGFLSNYTAKHFSDEEKLQVQYKYPDYFNHKKLHDSFKHTVRDLAGDLDAEGPTLVLVGKVNMKVGDWLVNHIKREDKKLANHIREAQ